MRHLGASLVRHRDERPLHAAAVELLLLTGCRKSEILTVDNVIAVMEAKHPNLSTQKSFYVEISCARHNAELVTDDAKALRETLEVATGERVPALEGIGSADKVLADEKTRGGKKEPGRGPEGLLERPSRTRDGAAADKSRDPEPERIPEPKQKSVEMDLGM